MEKIRGGGRTITLIPDAYFALKTLKGKAHFFLEVDRNTQTASKAFRQKMKGYKIYFERGLFQFPCADMSRPAPGVEQAL
ncbi:MAG: replication-relaxation family protein [Thermodesulfobacteriota bacterium]